MKALHTLYIMVLAACLCSCGKVDVREIETIDSLNVQAYWLRFTSARESMRYADEVLAKYGESKYRDGVHRALLNKATSYYMLMRYDSVRVCCDVVQRESRNDMLRALADVNMMMACNMLAQSKEFYDYRNDARERIKRIEEEMALPSRSDDISVKTGELAFLLAQYHIASLHYFVRMRLTDEMNESAEWLDANAELFEDDATLMANYMMLKSMLNLQSSDTNEDNITLQRRTLIQLLEISTDNGFNYITAEALHRLARSIISNGELRPAMAEYLKGIAAQQAMLEGRSMAESLGEELDLCALSLFQQYGNRYTISRALITLSDYKLQQGLMDDALIPLRQALQLVNEHHRLINPAHVHICDSLAMFAPIENEELSTEMVWIADPDVMAVPIWMQSVREQLSVVYGAMGRKAESDYNHNLYFDILDATRQDQRVEQERERLASEESKLNLLIIIFVAALVLMAWGIYVFNKRSEARYRQQVAQLKDVIDECKRMVENLSSDSPSTEERVGERSDWGEVLLCQCRKWVDEKRQMFDEFADEEERIDAETYSLGKKYEEAKKQYLEKLVSMSIVEGITPFLDRALHEVEHNQGGTYLLELIDKINAYNEVLGHWVKIRQGEVTLSIESFALQPLLDMMRLSEKAFAQKGIALTVGNSAEAVKADRALTLFMMNTLLDNARKYTPQGGTVSLTAQDMGDCVEIAVEDTGHGMSKEDVATINGQKVYDSSAIGASDEAVRTQKGFGFGLMNCRGIIEKYRKLNALFAVCQFGVSSEQGKGSRFFFRLPKGVMRAVTTVALVMMSIVGIAADHDDFIAQAEYYAECQFSANVEGEYEQSIVYADSAIAMLNDYYLAEGAAQIGDKKGTKLMRLDGGAMAEIDWWRSGFDINYDLIIGIRNEVAIAALALNRNHLYHYNSECFKRLYTLANTDNTLEEYCNDARRANRNRRAIAIALGLIMAVMLIVYFFIHYRRYQLFIFNIRQFIDLKDFNDFKDFNDLNDLKATTDEEALIIDLMRQLVATQERIAKHKVSEHGELIELKRDERRRIEREQQRVHVQNMIMDNCMSTLKHETMFYPNRIKQILSQSEQGESHADCLELLRYYKQVFTLLSTCASKQVERVLFKRTIVEASAIGDMARKAYKRIAQKDRSVGKLIEGNEGKELRVMIDRTFMQVLIANILSLYQEHRAGGDLAISYSEMDHFVRFTFTDTAYRIAPDDVPNLFYVDSVTYDPQRDTLVGMQYLIAKQIIREHDRYATHRGCRIYVEPTDDGHASRFVFTLPKA